MDKISGYRQEIDQIDEKLLELINRRADLAARIGKRKKKNNSGHHVPEREIAVLKRLHQLNQGLLEKNAVEVIFKEIISACRAMEGMLKIGYLGPEATFTHQASVRQFGSSSEFVPYKTIKDVFYAVLMKKINYGVVPVENSSEGGVGYTLDMFMETDLKISAELTLGISHFLLSSSGQKDKIEKIYSHPQPLNQCRQWLSNFFPNTPLLEVTSTAKAAQLCGSEPGAAAIASELAMKYYNLKAVYKNIEDTPNNITRFIVISHDIGNRTGNDKTTLLFSVEDKSGALCNILSTVGRYDINMSKIESRPSRKKAWEYFFFLDLAGHVKDDNMKQAIKEIEGATSFFKVLGSYPAARDICAD